MTTRTECDAKLDAIERIIGQVRRYDGAQAADLIVYGGVSLKELAWTELEPEEIASAAMGGVTEEFRIVPDKLLVLCAEWQDDRGDILQISACKKKFTWSRIGARYMDGDLIAGSIARARDHIRSSPPRPHLVPNRVPRGREGRR